MSMPQYFTIAVISDRYPGGPELAATAAAMLRNSGHNSRIQPEIVGASTFTGCRLILSQACLARGTAIAEPISPHLLVLPQDVVDEYFDCNCRPFFTQHLTLERVLNPKKGVCYDKFRYLYGS